MSNLESKHTKLEKKIIALKNQASDIDVKNQMIEIHRMFNELYGKKDVIQQQASYFDSAPIPLFMVDIHGIVHEMNTNAYHLLNIEDNTQNIDIKHFIEIGYQETFENFLRDIFEDSEATFCNVKFRNNQEKNLIRLKGTVHFDSKNQQKLAEIVVISSNNFSEAEQKIQEQYTEIQQQKEEINSTLEELITTNEALSESEEKYRRLIENLRHEYVFYTFDIRGYFDYVSPSAETILGYSIEEIKEDYTRYLSPKSSNFRIFSRSLKDLKESGRKQAPYELEIIDIEGNLHIFEIIETLIFDDAGMITAIDGIAHDITQRKKAEEALRISEERYSLVIEATNDGIWDWNPLTDKVYFSQRWKQIIGYDKYYIGDTANEWRDRIHPDDRKRVLADQKSFLENKDQKTYHNEYRFRHRLGHYIWLQTNSICLRDTTGTPYRVVGSHTDISRRKKAQEELKRSEKKLRAIFNNAIVGIAIISPERRYLYFNETWAGMLGYTEEELYKLSTADITHEDDIEKSEKLFYKLATKKIENFTVAKRYVRKDGSVFWGNLSVSPLYDDNEDIEGIIGVITNIDKQKANEAKLRELNVTKDKFFSIIAHDLKNPFNILLGFSETLYSNTEEFSKNEISEYAGYIYQTSKNTYSLLENLLEWSRTQTGRIPFSPKAIDLKELIKGCINDIKSIAASKSIQLFLAVTKRCEVFADANMVNTVVRNLITNAIKFTYPGGVVTVSISDAEAFYRVSVTDNGVGIPKSKIESLFRIDVNHSTTGTNHEKGTGLGLIICKEFIERNGGEIWVNSEEGRGSRFHFTLPKKQKNKEVD